MHNTPNIRHIILCVCNICIVNSSGHKVSVLWMPKIPSLIISPHHNKIAMEAMAHRNRWFTVLNSIGGSFHGYVSHNQRVNATFSKIKFIPDML